MWLDAIDFLFGTHLGLDLCPGLESSSTPTFMFTISNMAQSSGLTAELLLSGLNPPKSLASQLFPLAVCLHNSPTLQDSLTTAAGKRLEDVVGGPQALADLTGCRTCE